MSMEGFVAYGLKFGEAQVKAAIRGVGAKLVNSVSGTVRPAAAPVPEAPSEPEEQNPSVRRSHMARAAGVARNVVQSEALRVAGSAVAGPYGAVLSGVAGRFAKEGTNYSTGAAAVDAASITAGVTAAQLASAAMGAFVSAPIAIPGAGLIATSVIAGVAGQIVRNRLRGQSAAEDGAFPTVTRNRLRDNDFEKLDKMRNEFITKHQQMQELNAKFKEVDSNLEAVSVSEPNQERTSESIRDNLKVLNDQMAELAHIKIDMESIIIAISTIGKNLAVDTPARRDEYRHKFENKVLDSIRESEALRVDLAEKVDAQMKSLKTELKRKKRQEKKVGKSAQHPPSIPSIITPARNMKSHMESGQKSPRDVQKSPRQGGQKGRGGRHK